LELDAATIRYPRSGRLIVHVNKVSHVKTINLVAKDLGEDEDWLFDVAMEMEPEDGVIWVYGVGDEGFMAFTDFGIESLIELIKMHKDDPSLLARSRRKLAARRPTPDAYLSHDFAWRKRLGNRLQSSGCERLAL
jgi:hypothetical protein